MNSWHTGTWGRRIRDPRAWILGFVGFHIAAIFLCDFPGSSPVRRVLSEPFRPYVTFFDLGQNWSMFAPEPSSLNGFLRGEVKYQDGSTGFYEFPRMCKLGLMDRFFKERYRKWAIDNVRADSHRADWPATARYVARQANRNPAVPPVEVSLWRHWVMVKDPMVEFVPVGYRVPDEKLETFRFHVEKITPADLQIGESR